MDSLADPQGASVLVAAVTWLQATLLGTVATTVAIIAVAAVGFEMLLGRVDMRRGLTVVLGCFILFGASSIVAGLMSMRGLDTAQPNVAAVALPPALPTPSPTSLQSPPGYDPYAGAAVPQGISR